MPQWTIEPTPEELKPYTPALQKLPGSTYYATRAYRALTDDQREDTWNPLAMFLLFRRLLRHRDFVREYRAQHPELPSRFVIGVRAWTHANSRRRGECIRQVFRVAGKSITQTGGDVATDIELDGEAVQLGWADEITVLRFYDAAQ